MENAESRIIKWRQNEIYLIMNDYFVRILEKSELILEHPERYAIMRTDAFRDIYNHPMSQAMPKELGGYLAITNKINGKTIYRKYRGSNIVEDNHVILDYRTICELQLPKEQEAQVVSINKSNWWRFYFFNSDLGIKIPAWLGIFGLLITLVSMLLSIFFYIYPKCC